MCVYNDNEIGLFKRMSWNTRPYKTYLGDKFKAGNIYVGIDTDHIGMEKTHEEIFNRDIKEPIGTCVKYNKKRYISDCEIEKAVNLDTIRMYMYSDGKLENYTPGKATTKELLDTLIYSYDYFKLDINKVRLNKRIF